MRDRLLDFVDHLRQAGVEPGPAEVIDAVRAVTVAGVEREVLREALAATLVKDQADRAVFDEVFDRCFALPAPAVRRPGPGRRVGEPGGGGRGRGGAGALAARPPRAEPDPCAPAARPPLSGPRDERGPSRAREREAAVHSAAPRQNCRAAALLARRRALLQRPFRDMQPEEIEEVEQLLRLLAATWRSRWRRRVRRTRRGVVDIRATARLAARRGGVPAELVHRCRRPGKSDLLALVDLSHSTATASRFFLSLLCPADRWFRHTTILAYVDRPVPIAFEAGQVFPEGPLDLHARSDFGRVLERLVREHEGSLNRNTVLLVLGDARNNRRPPRADLLRRSRERVRAVVWLNPEPRERWDTGDSVMAAYLPWIDEVLPAHDLRTLARAVDRLLRRAAR